MQQYNMGQTFGVYQEQSQPRKSQHLDTLYGQARTRFIQKVYTILSMQLSITAIVTIISMSSESFFLFQLTNTWVMILAFIGLIITEIYLFCCNAGRQYPKNMILLGIFTLCESYLVSYICSATAVESGKGVIIMAAIMTAAIVLACTVYAFKTQSDFTTSYGLMLVLSVALFLLMIFCMFSSSPFLHKLYCTFGVIVFGFYLIVDTQLIMGGKKAELTVDDYVIAAMYLYIDVIQIFLYILELLSKKE